MPHANHTADFKSEGRVSRAETDDQLLLAAGVLKAALDCIVAVDGQARIIEFNPAAEQTFGWSREEAIGQPMDEMISPSIHRAAHREGMARYLAGGAPRVLGRRLELEARRRDGSSHGALRFVVSDGEY